MKVLFEDNHIIAVEKPFGILTQGDKTGDICLADEVKAYLKEKYNKPGEVYLGTVHRLDRVTGGVIVFARTSKAAARLSDQIRRGTTKKCYAALVCGEMEVGSSGALKHYLVKDEDRNIVSVYDREIDGSKYAELSYKVTGCSNGSSIVEVELATGRSHQIRVQMAKIGHPIVGDVKYGGFKVGDGKSIRLWSCLFGFEHPTLKEWVEVRSEVGF